MIQAIQATEWIIVSSKRLCQCLQFCWWIFPYIFELQIYLSYKQLCRNFTWWWIGCAGESWLINSSWIRMVKVFKIQKSAITLSLPWTSALSSPISRGDKIMKNTWLNCWQNSYCLYLSWKRLLGLTVQSLLLIGWLNRGLLSPDRLDWLYSSSRSWDSELRERQGESRQRGNAGGEGGSASSRASPWLPVPIVLLSTWLPQTTTYWGAFSFTRGCQLQAPARNNRLHLGIVHLTPASLKRIFKRNKNQVFLPPSSLTLFQNWTETVSCSR